MAQALKLTGYFAGALFSAQEIYGNRLLAEAIDSASHGAVKIDLPQDMSTQETGEGQVIRAADYLGMIQRDFVFANMNGPDLDSGTVAEYVVASMFGMPRVQYRTDFRNVGDVRSEFPPGVTVRKTEAVPYNLMLGHDESATVLVNSMELYKSPGGLPAFLNAVAVAAVKGIQLAFGKTQTATPAEYAGWRKPLAHYLNLDAAVIEQILLDKRRRHESDEYRQAIKNLLALQL